MLTLNCQSRTYSRVKEDLPRVNCSTCSSFLLTKHMIIRRCSGMKSLWSDAKLLRAKPARERANIRIILSVCAFFLLGGALGAFWGSRVDRLGKGMPHPEPGSESANAFSPTTKGLLASLSSPVEVRFYSVLDPATTSESLRAFAGRVDQLLARYQSEANGKIILTRSNSLAYVTATSAVADGITPFDEQKGEPSFLGIAISSKAQKTALAQLFPEWESALEADITRAIRTIASATLSSTAAAPLGHTESNSAVVDDLRAMIPNLDSISLSEAIRIVREASLKEFAAAANRSQVQLKEAQQRLMEAQNGSSESEQQTAMKNLQQIQLDQTDQLKRIAAKAQAQIGTLKRLKAGTP